MGGNAFKNLLPHASFPRMQPVVYSTLKSQLLPILHSFYAHATVPPECPGKMDYGDLDVVVSGPREGLTHEELKEALRATCSVPLEGNRTSNFAIPANAFDTVAEALRTEPDHKLTTGDAAGFFQVDVNVCADHTQLERTAFYMSYGDLGFFLGLLAQTAGLSFNIFGLKLADPIPTLPPQTFYLSYSVADIVDFLGLSMDRWQAGFATQEDVFIWVATSPFIHPLVARYRSPDYRSSTKERADARPMRKNFVHFLQTHDFSSDAQTDASVFAAPGRLEEKLDAALRFFGKDREHAKLIHASHAQQRSKEILNGMNVQAWTNVSGMPVRFIIDEVKDRLSGVATRSPADAGFMEGVPDWQRTLLTMSDEDVRALVTTVKEELQEAGRLDFDWQAAKAAKLERKRQKEFGSDDTAVDGDKKRVALAVVVA